MLEEVYANNTGSNELTVLHKRCLPGESFEEVCLPRG